MSDIEDRNLFTYVAGFLGDGWQVDESQTYPIVIRHADGNRTLDVCRVASSSGPRFSVSAWAPGDRTFSSDEQRAGLKTHHEITFSARVQPEKMAHHITRRLLPGYQRSLLAAMDSINDARAVQARREATLNELAEAGAAADAVIVTGRDSGQPEEVQLPHARKRTPIYGRLRPDPDTQAVRITISGVPPDLACQIMTVISARASDLTD